MSFRVSLWLMVGVICIGVRHASPAKVTRVADDVKFVSASGSAESSSFMEAAGKLFFSSFDPVHGQELWVTDGTRSGTRLVQDVRVDGPRNASSFPFLVTTDPDGVVFTAGGGVWRSDGTPEGTAKTFDLDPTRSAFDIIFASRLDNFAAIDDSVLFSIEPLFGSTRWVAAIEGEPTRTIRTFSGAVQRLSSTSEGVYLLAESGLWFSDGTVDGTFQIRDFVQLPPRQPIPDDSGVALFVADSDGLGLDLWQTDGTLQGTRVVVDLDALTLRWPTRVGETIYFSYDDGVSGEELWRVDQSHLNPIRVADIAPGSTSSSPQNLIQLGDRQLLFTADDGIRGRDLWASDGTPAGTRLVAELRKGAEPIHVAAVLRVGDEVAVLETTRSATLWVTDGTAEGTRALADRVEAVGVFGDEIYFSAPLPSTPAGFSLSSTRYGLWRTGGTRSFVEFFVNTSMGDASSNPARLTPLGQETVYVIRSNNRIEFRFVPSMASESRSIDRLPSDFRVEETVACGETLFVTAQSGLTAPELWTIERAGRDAFRLSLAESDDPDLRPIDVRGIVADNDVVRFVARHPSVGRELWESSCSEPSIRLLRDVRPGPEDGVRDLITSRDGVSLFSGQDSSFNELFALPPDGDTAIALADIRPGPGSASITPGLVEFQDALFFGATGGLWRTDATQSGTERVRLIFNQQRPRQLTVARDRLFFTVPTSAFGEELWVSDGTSEGTRLVVDLLPGRQSSAPSTLTAIGGMVLFAASDLDGDRELWRSDGTAEGTYRVIDIWEGLASSDPEGLTRFEDRVVFSAANSEFGRELWESDGTACGTRRLTDIARGVSSASPENLVVTSEGLFFSANDAVAGEPANRELWRLDRSGEAERRPECGPITAQP